MVKMMLTWKIDHTNPVRRSTEQQEEDKDKHPLIQAPTIIRMNKIERIKNRHTGDLLLKSEEEGLFIGFKFWFDNWFEFFEIW